MQNGKQVALWVDEQFVEISERVDLKSGKVIQDRFSAKEFCQSRGIDSRPLTAELKELVLYTKKGKDGQPIAVTLGEFGPFALAKLEHGVVCNAFSHEDLGKPMKISRDTLVALADIFGGRPEPAAE